MVSPRRVHTEERPPSTADVADAKTVSADEIYTRYSQDLHDNGNPDQRYINRWLVVTGAFNNVNRSLPPHVYLELRTHDPEGFVYAELSSGAGSLIPTLQPGMMVRLLCRGNGMTIGSPLLRACRPA
jgi:hypothetical protein